MKSKTKALKKGNHIPGNATPAPAKKAETNNATNVASKNHYARDKRKEYAARSRARRIRSLMKQNISKEQIEEWMHEEDNRFILCLIYSSFCVKDGDKKLYGVNAFKKFCEDNELKIMSVHTGSAVAGWILSDKENVDKAVETLNAVGRVSVTKPEQHTASKPEKDKAPTNNTNEVKRAAKIKRKEAKKANAKMRPYYAALRKGGVSKRIKKYNKSLAEKIEAWIKDKKKTDAKNAENNKEYRAKHRQLTSVEMKTNKNARKAAKHIASQKRRQEQEKTRMKNNTTANKKRVQKARKHVQTKLNLAA